MLDSFKFHHIGYAVFSIENTAKYYIGAGYEASDITEDPIQNIRICFLKKESMPLIELLEAINETSPVLGVLKKVGVSPYHCCYEVEDIEESVRQLKKQRFIPTGKIVEACALENRRICFLYNREVGLIELLENKS